jgi:hypothetical protein
MKGLASHATPADAAHVALPHRYGLGAVLEEEVLHLLLDFRVRRYVRGNPPLDDRISTARILDLADRLLGPNSCPAIDRTVTSAVREQQGNYLSVRRAATVWRDIFVRGPPESR